jgi:hypothetical protein
MSKRETFVKGFFNYENLTVTLGSELSTKNPLKIATAIKVPDFTYTSMETADAGGGWSYGYKEEVTRTERNAFIIIYNNEVIGWMCPYRGNIKSDLYPIDWKHTRKPIRDFAETLIPQPRR